MINHIGKYNDAQAIQDALDAGTLANPYVAMTSAGTLDWNSLAPTQQVETRIKNTYRVTEEFWRLTSGETEDNRKFVVSYHGPEFGVEKVELEDGTEIEYEEGSGYYAPATGAGDYVVYITVSGDTIGGSEEMSEGLFGGLSLLVASEIPDSINTIGYGAYSCTMLESVVFPNHPMTIGAICFSDIPLSSINNGQNLIPAGSVVGSWAFNETQLDHITIGSGVTFPKTDGSAGQFQDSLTAVTFLGTVPPVIYPSAGDESGDYGTFNWADIQEIHVPVGSEQAYVSSFNTDLAGEYTFQVAGTGLIEVDQSPSE